MKKIFLSLLPMVATFMGFKPEAKEPLNFSAEEKQKLDAYAKQEGFAEAFMEHFNTEHLQANADAMKAFDDFMKELNAKGPKVEASADADADADADEVPKTDAKTTASALQALILKAQGLAQSNAELSANNEKLKILPEDDVPEAVIQYDPNNVKAVKHSKTHLFASNKSWDSLDLPWNKNALKSFDSDSLQPKAATEWNKVNIDKLNDELGAYSRRNSDEIMSMLMDGYELPPHWTVVKNIQDEYVFTSIATGEVTQAFKKEWLPKNKQRFVPIINKIFDKQIDIAWAPSELKSIEKSWLNMFFNEGSTPYKAGFVSFLVGEILKKARKEDKISIISGVYSDPELQPTKAGSFLNSMNGLLKLIDKNRNVTYKAHSLPTLTATNTYDVLTKYCQETLPLDFRNLPGLKIGAGSDVQRWYVDGLETAKALRPNFQENSKTIDGKDNITFYVHPELDGTGFFYLTTEDNLGIMIDKPGEDGIIVLERALRAINGMADYKLGVFVKAFGAAVDANAPLNYEDQIFFSNEAEVLTNTYVPVAGDDTTPSVTEHYALKIGGNNTSATNVTKLDDAVEGQFYYLIGDSATKKSTIKNGSNIILSDGDMALGLGDKMTLIGLAGGKVIEFSRTVASAVPTEEKVQLAEDATTADASNGTWFITQANANATAITNITNAIVGEIYTIEGGNPATNATTIAASGNFLLSASFTASAGSILKVKYNGSKFVETSRA